MSSGNLPPGFLMGISVSDIEEQNSLPLESTPAEQDINLDDAPAVTGAPASTNVDNTVPVESAENIVEMLDAAPTPISNEIKAPPTPEETADKMVIDILDAAPPPPASAAPAPAPALTAPRRVMFRSFELSFGTPGVWCCSGVRRCA